MRLDLSRVAAYDARTLAAERAEQSAVLVPVLDRADGDWLLFADRSEDLEQHAGEMSFPGGGRDDRDADLAATALREANEEVGLAPEEAEVVGHLDDVPGPFGHVVRPYVARVPDREYVPDGREIVATVPLPAARLVDPGTFHVEDHSHPERGEIRLPYFTVDEHVVWGLTGRILSTVLRVTTDWEPPEDHV